MFGAANITVTNRIEYPYDDATIAEITEYLLRLKQTSRSKWVHIINIFLYMKLFIGIQINIKDELIGWDSSVRLGL